MARLLVLDDPDQLRGGTRARGMVVSVLADGADPGRMAGAQFLVLDVPDLTVSDAQATYLMNGVPQSALDAQAAEEARYQSDVHAALTAHAADLAAGTMTQADVLATVTPFDETKRVNRAAYPWRAKRIALATLAGIVSGLGARRTYLATTLANFKTMLDAQRTARATRAAAMKARVQEALANAATVAGEDAATDPEDISDVEDAELAVKVAALLEERKRRRLLRTRAVPPLTVTAAQLVAATVDVL